MFYNPKSHETGKVNAEVLLSLTCPAFWYHCLNVHKIIYILTYLLLRPYIYLKNDMELVKESC